MEKRIYQSAGPSRDSIQQLEDEARQTQTINKVQMLNTVGNQPESLLVLTDSLFFLKQGGLFPPPKKPCYRLCGSSIRNSGQSQGLIYIGGQIKG